MGIQAASGYTVHTSSKIRDIVSLTMWERIWNMIAPACGWKNLGCQRIRRHFAILHDVQPLGVGWWQWTPLRERNLERNLFPIRFLYFLTLATATGFPQKLHFHRWWKTMKKHWIWGAACLDIQNQCYRRLSDLCRPLASSPMRTLMIRVQTSSKIKNLKIELKFETTLTASPQLMWGHHTVSIDMIELRWWS